jgi:hypothetical protein
MTVLEHIDHVSFHCGYFTADTTVNNGYGCSHPDQHVTDFDFLTNKKHGMCYCFSCPLGNEADEQDFLEHGEDPALMSEGEWLVLEENWKT